MQLRDLEYFEVVAKLENFGQAAEIVGRTTPAMTKSIHRLEEDIGAKLFVRQGRGSVLTAAGKLLLARAAELKMQVSEIRREVRDFGEGAAGHLRIGVGATPAQEILPNVTPDLLESAPDVTFEILIDINHVLRDALRQGQLDLVIGPVQPEEEKEFICHLLMVGDIVVAACKDHPLLRKKATLEDLVAQRWVLPAHSAEQRKWLDKTFADHRLPPPRVQIETNSPLTLPELIARTPFLSFLQRRQLWPARADSPLREVKLAATTMRRQFGIIYREHAYLPPAAHRFIALLLEDARRRNLMERPKP